VSVWPSGQADTGCRMGRGFGCRMGRGFDSGCCRVLSSLSHGLPGCCQGVVRVSHGLPMVAGGKGSWSRRHVFINI